MIAQQIELVDPFAQAEESFQRMIRSLRSTPSLIWDLTQLEHHIQTMGRELMRQLLQAHLDVRGMGFIGDSCVGGDKVERTHKRDTNRGILSIFGRVQNQRIAYQTEGVASLMPKDASLNLPPELYSHGLRKQLAIESARGSFEDAIDAVERATGVSVPKRQAQQLVVRAASDFDSFYQNRAQESTENPSPTSELLVLTEDQKGVAMCIEDLRPQTKRAAQRKKKTRKVRLSPGEKRQSKRMSCVASVYTIAPDVRTPEELAGEQREVRAAKLKKRPKPENKRVWASLKKDQTCVTRELFDEALERDPKKQKKWVCVVDGQPHQLSVLKREAKRRQLSVTFILDLIHVLDYLWSVAHMLSKTSEQSAEEWVGEKLLELLYGRCQEVAESIRQSAQGQELTEGGQDTVATCCGYLLENKELMRYDEYLKEGYPIASGVIEGACRSLVKDRMGLSGARWRLDSAEAVLQLRALIQSGDFEEYWEFHLQCEYQDHHAFHFNEPPRAAQPIDSEKKRGHLRVVK